MHEDCSVFPVDDRAAHRTCQVLANEIFCACLHVRAPVGAPSRRKRAVVCMGASWR
jgi:hypothetical protein